ncbi:MAG: peptide deformylase [Ignavibacteriaceae bacterium]|nr:peptide deformylase [Ignavibacteriaceae bacterium]
MKKLFLITALSLFLAGCAGVGSIEKKSSFTESETRLIMSGGGNAPMRVLSVYNSEDSLILRTQCSDVVPDSNDPVLKNLIDRMYATVTDSVNDGVGIAAPQVGVIKNVIWVQRYDKPGTPFEVYLNPKIKQYTKRKLNWVEGCLSIPGRRDTTTTRSYAILLEYDKPDKSRNIEMVEGFTAIIFQHEIDHINGILYLDRLK